MISCKRCHEKEVDVREVTFANGTKHLKATCCACGGFIQYVQQEIEGDQSDFLMPFGKHKDKTLLMIAMDDPDYLIWASENLKGSIKQRVIKFLNEPAKPRQATN
jgi:hypothetical protein